MKEQWTAGSDSQPNEQIPTAHAPTTATRACGVHHFPEDGRHLQLPGRRVATAVSTRAIQSGAVAAGPSQLYELGSLRPSS
jgi:hypothetical protein